MVCHHCSDKYSYITDQAEICLASETCLIILRYSTGCPLLQPLINLGFKNVFLLFLCIIQCGTIPIPTWKIRFKGQPSQLYVLLSDTWCRFPMWQAETILHQELNLPSSWVLAQPLADSCCETPLRKRLRQKKKKKNSTSAATVRRNVWHKPDIIGPSVFQHSTLYPTKLRVLSTLPINHLYAPRGRFIRPGRWLEMRFITG